MILVTLLFALLLNEATIQTAQSQFDAGNYKAALDTLSTALAKSPNDAPLHYWSARSNYELRDYDKAISESETAVKLDPKNAEYNRWLGRAYGAKAEQSRSFFLARKVKQAFEAAVRLAPGDIAARRDLMQYCVEAPWIVGGDKDKARQQIDAIAAIDPIQGKMARAAYLATDKQWKAAEAEYVSLIGQHPQNVDAYMEAADYFTGRNDANNLERVINAASQIGPQDPRLNYYRAVVLVLRQSELPTAAKLLQAYISVPERSDYPSHRSATEWLRRTSN
jgi:tetratricopeptide (TPR) repeat protein